MHEYVAKVDFGFVQHASMNDPMNEGVLVLTCTESFGNLTKCPYGFLLSVLFTKEDMTWHELT